MCNKSILKRFTAFVPIIVFSLFAVSALAPSASAEIRSDNDGVFLRFWDTVSLNTVGVMADMQIYDEFSGAAEFLNNSPTPWIFAGVNSATLSIVAASNGIATITLGAADNDDADLASELIWTSGQSCAMEARIKASTTVIGYNVGFTDATGEAADTMAVTYSGTTLTSTASDCALFFVDSDATTNKIYSVAVKADTDGTVTDSGTAPVANDYNVFRVEIDSVGNCDFWLNGAHVGVELLGITTTDPLCVYIAAIRRDGAAGEPAISVDYIRAWQRRN